MNSQPVQADVVIMPDGSFQIFVRQGNYENGRERIEQLIAKLQATGLQFSGTSEIEQHATEGVDAQVHDYLHTLGHEHEHC